MSQREEPYRVAWEKGDAGPAETGRELTVSEGGLMNSACKRSGRDSLIPGSHIVVHVTGKSMCRLAPRSLGLTSLCT